MKSEPCLLKSWLSWCLCQGSWCESYTEGNFRHKKSHETLESDRASEQAWETSTKSQFVSISMTASVTFSLIFDLTLPFPFLPFHHHLCPHFPTHSPIAVDVSGRHRVAEVGPHLEQITNKTLLACNHTEAHRSLSFLSFSFSMSFFFSLVASTTTPRSFPPQSLNPTIPWGVFGSFFTELSVWASVSWRKGRGSEEPGLALL